MTPYILSYIFYFSVLIINIRSSYLRWWLLLASVPMVALVFFRGLVGVDMLVYEQSINVIHDAGMYTFTFEPLFEYMILLFSNFIEDPSIVLAVFSALTTLFVFIGTFRIERQPSLIAFFLIPYFYLDMTMNGIRAGLAFSIILYSVNYLINGRRMLYLCFALAAALLHISSALLAVLLIVLLERRLKALLWAAGLGFLLMIYFDTYLNEKFVAYQAIGVESAGGGLAPLILSLSLLATFYIDKMFGEACKVQLLILGGISVAAYILTQFTYAGIRFQTLNLFLISVFLVSIGKSKNLRIDKKTLFIIFLIGMAGAGFRLRNFYTEAGKGDAPFVPYHFFWER